MGGAGDGSGTGEVRIETRITRESLEGFSPLESLGTIADGAVLLFEGRVRETNEGRTVARLGYDVYGEMAERELEDICRCAADRFAIGAVSAAHRVGELDLGEVSVAIGVAAPHRDACYAASRWVIEEIKARLPIWKHEHYEDGESHWVGAPESLESGSVGGAPVSRGERDTEPGAG